MIEFKTPTPADRSWVTALIGAEGAMGSECNFNNIYLWNRVYGQEIARLGDRLLVHLKGGRYLFPCGSGDLAPAVEALAEDAHSRGGKLHFVCLSPEQKAQLKELWPDRFEYDCQWDRASWDYIYDVNKLADLVGKKLHSKRNHIHRFDEQFPDWLAEPITADNVEECVAMERVWAAAKAENGGDETLSEETISILEALYLRDELELHGVLIRAAGKVVAFSLGSFTTPECFDVHYEKAFGEIQGAYPVVNRELARMIRAQYPNVKWFNREDDLGLEGLRKAKLSYYPEILLEKCSACER